MSLLKSSCLFYFVHTANAATARDAQHSEPVGMAHFLWNHALKCAIIYIILVRIIATGIRERFYEAGIFS